MNHGDYLDQLVIKCLSNAILDADERFYIELFDGEEVSVKPTRDKKPIFENATATGEDWFRVKQLQDDGSFRGIGSFYLIYNNRDWGDDAIATISDYSWKGDTPEKPLVHFNIIEGIYRDTELRLEELVK